MKWVFTFLLFISLCGCERATVDLGAGYKLVGLDGRNASIVNRRNLNVVDPNVSQYKVVESYVVGMRDDAKIDGRLSKKYGYFILDKRSGMLAEGLNKHQFEDAIRARNLSIEPF